ncbi:MAG: hypothetical protein KGO48_12890 [Alphaproteobacteria bacterium]|nr:hypothetical protein [Alphaproteobacteria bacterium]
MSVNVKIKPRGTYVKASGLLACAGILTGAANAAPADASHPDFAPTVNVGWRALTSEFIAPPSGPGPLMDDPAHPYVSNNLAARTGKIPTFPVGDISNPILQPWAREAVRKHNEVAISGKSAYTLQARCWPMGVPGFLLYPVRPVYFVQTDKEVLMTWTGDHMSRHVYMNVPHSKNLKPSWFGESVGHYEGDTLVVDTIGLNDRTFVDNFRTPHTTQLHVVQRYRMIDGGKTLEVKIHVEDPGAFTTPWDAIQRYQRVEIGPMDEETCAEGARDYFNQDAEPIPQAILADF